MPTDLAISTPFLITILAVVMLLLAGGAFFAVYVSFCDRLFKRIFHRPKPIPQVDRSPMEIDRSTIFGRGKNWFQVGVAERQGKGFRWHSAVGILQAVCGQVVQEHRDIRPRL